MAGITMLDTLSGVLALAMIHLALSTALRVVYGNKRQTMGTMGGSKDVDNKRTSSMLREVFAYAVTPQNHIHAHTGVR